MSDRTNTKFKMWQRLPMLADGRTEGPPPIAGARGSDSLRIGSIGGTPGRRPVRKQDAGLSQKLKFIFTTHD